MGLDLWFREDVARILASTFEAIQSSQAATNGGGNANYQQGVEDALRAVGIAFGVATPRAMTRDASHLTTGNTRSNIRTIDGNSKRNHW